MPSKQYFKNYTAVYIPKDMLQDCKNKVKKVWPNLSKYNDQQVGRLLIAFAIEELDKKDPSNLPLPKGCKVSVKFDEEVVDG